MIEPSWVGRRVSVRRVVERRDDGRLLQSDVVGDLLDLDDTSAVIESRGGVVEVPLALVTIAKLVAPSTAEELMLERVIANGWRPAEHEELDGWTLRADHGFTQRANSALPLRQLRMRLDEVLGAAHDWYAERGLPLRLQLPIEARRLLDAELGERGWEPSIDVAVLVCRLETKAYNLLIGPPVEFADAPDDAWLSVWRGGAAPPTARELLTRHDAVAFASLRLDGRTVAVGRATLDAGWSGVTCVEVDPAYRRRGLAGFVVVALEHWGTEHGATRSVLEVESDNTAALALYAQHGYWHHHDYRYRTEPS